MWHREVERPDRKRPLRHVVELTLEKCNRADVWQMNSFTRHTYCDHRGTGSFDFLSAWLPRRVVFTGLEQVQNYHLLLHLLLI